MKGIGYFSHQKSGCFWYRIKRPMDILQANNIPTQMIRLHEDVSLDDMQSLQVYGIFPFSFDKALDYIKSQGIRLIYDMDDALDFIDTNNPFYYSIKRDAFSAEEIFKHADHITVATPALATYARTKTNVPITVVPNCYDPLEWTFPRPKREGIRIGFAGSCTHIEDLLLVLPAIKNLKDKYDIRFVIFGFGPENYATWLRNFRFACTPDGRRDLDTFEALMKDIPFEWVPFVDFDYFPSTLINISLDIGLCPLKNTAFNRARSASKAMEYTLAGALALTTDIETYSNDPTSVTVKDGHWEEALELYITDVELRKNLHQEHLTWIKNNRNINNQLDLLKSVYVVE